MPPKDKVMRSLTVQHWFNKNKVENHPNATAYFKPRSGIIKMQTVQEGDVSRKSYKRLHRHRYSPTAAYGNNEVHLHPYKERRISAAEAMAIQSLPKEFELPPDMSLSDMFKTIGNGVPFLLSDGIAKTIEVFLEENLCKN
jgi:DNA (cytosine-5)-methyltransferase 1